ncbi:MAG: heme-binding protein [Sulfuritalea sp.]|nr:heme-binding protein [Sulfuritalea sp.]
MLKLKLPAFLLTLSALWMGNAMAIEEPTFKVLVTDGSFEIRQYAPMLVAETLVEGDMDEASSKGFRLIADFIFGNNQVSNAQTKSKIAMTAPVTAEPQSSKISMTAPVTLEPSSAAMTMQTAKQWRISFVMPSQYTMENIPKPNNNAVRLKEIPGKYFAVQTYSGFNTLARVQRKTDETLEWAGKRALKMIGTPQISRYDPPWTLPLFRRNEIMVEISGP